MDPRSPSGDPGPATPEPDTRRQFWRSPAVVVGAVALLAVIVAVVAAAAMHGGHGPGAGAVSVSAGSVRTVELQAVPGQLTIVGSATGRVTLNGHLDWTGHAAPAATTRMVNAHVLRLRYRCATASPCTAHWRLVVPRHTAVVLSQPSGHVIVSGLAGALRITAASVDVTATRLSSPSLQAVITSGHLAATFIAPPRQVSLTLTSAQATVSLPGSVAYAVSDQVTSGYVHVGVPVTAGAAHTVTARVLSGELDLQTS